MTSQSPEMTSSFDLSTASALNFAAQIGLNPTEIDTINSAINKTERVVWTSISVLTLSLLFPEISLLPGTEAYIASLNINWYSSRSALPIFPTANSHQVHTRYTSSISDYHTHQRR